MSIIIFLNQRQTYYTEIKRFKLFPQAFFFIFLKIGGYVYYFN